MKSISVLFLWKLSKQLQKYLQEPLRKLKGVTLIFPKTAEESELLKHAPKAHIIVGWRPSEELLDAAEKLELFIFPGAGVQHLVKWFKNQGQARNITLVNGHSNSEFVAQHTVALLLTLMNKIIVHHNWMVAGEWRKGDAETKSIPLRGRTIGLLGYGAINRKVHRLLAGFDVNFVIMKRSWEGKEQKLPTPAIRFDSSQLHAFLTKTDTLLIAAPQTAETEGLIGQGALKLLGPQGIIVNVSRGALVNQHDLYHALLEKTITGAAIDVWYRYQPEPDSESRKYPFEYPFHTLDNVVLSPHRAASPFDDLDRWKEVIENITRFAQGRTNLLNIVDVTRGY